jgi:hypothetical protein
MNQDIKVIAKKRFKDGRIYVCRYLRQSATKGHVQAELVELIKAGRVTNATLVHKGNDVHVRMLEAVPEEVIDMTIGKSLSKQAKRIPKVKPTRSFKPALMGNYMVGGKVLIEQVAPAWKVLRYHTNGKLVWHSHTIQGSFWAKELAAAESPNGVVDIASLDGVRVSLFAHTADGSRCYAMSDFGGWYTTAAGGRIKVLSEQEFEAVIKVPMRVYMLEECNNLENKIYEAGSVRELIKIAKSEGIKLNTLEGNRVLSMNNYFANVCTCLKQMEGWK